MIANARAVVACLLSAILVFLPAGWSQTTERSRDSAPVSNDLDALLQKGYLELFELSPELHFSSGQH